jgi:lysozyme
MRTSNQGLALLIEEEGFVPYAYNDPAGHATVGVGHLLHLGAVNAADQARYGTRARPRFSRDQAIKLLRSDVGAFERAVLSAVRVRLNQNEFDALVSLAFNIGTGAFAGSTVVRELNANRRGAAADAFLLWRNAGGRPILHPRRRRERALFLKGVGPADWLTPTELRRIRELDRLRRRNENPTRQRELVMRLAAQRKAIWRSAQPASKGGDGRGWDVRNRRPRYRSLLLRTQ